MELLEIKLLHKYARIKSYMHDLISGDFVVYDFLYECLADHIKSFVYDLTFIESEKVIRVYYDQLLNDSRQVSYDLYTLVMTVFDDNDWRLLR